MRLVAADYRPGRVDCRPACVLTASTSEAYAFLFKLLCEPGDEVLVPQPSYPLFDLLTRLEGVRAPCRYRLDSPGGWCLDRGSLGSRGSPAHARHARRQPQQPDGLDAVAPDDRDWLVGAGAGAAGSR